MFTLSIINGRYISAKRTKYEIAWLYIALLHAIIWSRHWDDWGDEL